MYLNFANRNRNPRKGFSLIELLVSLALFGFVIVAAVGAVLASLDGNRKSRSLVNVMDDLNFTLESMSRELRVGDSYDCSAMSADPTDFGDCPAGNSTMSFNSSDNTFMVYRLSGTKIQRCGSSNVGGVSGSNCAGNYIDMTGDDIIIDELTFYVQGSQLFPDTHQPRVTIVVAGTAGAGDTASEFSLQTTVTQRFPDF